MTAYNTRHLVGVAPCSGSYDFRAMRLCVRCGERKPMKGGATLNGRGFTCADCRGKSK